MKHNSEIIADDNGVELSVDYDYEMTDGYYEEPGNIASFVKPRVYTELKSVNVIIAGVAVNILQWLTREQKLAVVKKLEHE